jgi:hypothetical protein
MDRRKSWITREPELSGCLGKTVIEIDKEDHILPTEKAGDGGQEVEMTSDDV